jgi:hypothetical protein
LCASRPGAFQAGEVVVILNNLIHASNFGTDLGHIYHTLQRLSFRILEHLEYLPQEEGIERVECMIKLFEDEMSTRNAYSPKGSILESWRFHKAKLEEQHNKLQITS